MMSPTQRRQNHLIGHLTLLAFHLFGCTPDKGGGKDNDDSGGVVDTDATDGSYSDDYPPNPTCDESTLVIRSPDFAIDVPTTTEVVASLQMADNPYDDGIPSLELSARRVEDILWEDGLFWEASTERELAGNLRTVTYTFGPVVLQGDTDYYGGFNCGGGVDSSDWFATSWTFHTAAAPADTGAPE